MADAIKFGTSGWRGLIARDFTFENVRRLTHAIGEYLKSDVGCRMSDKRNPSSVIRYPPSVFVAYDTRYLAEEFARASAEVLAAQGHKVLLASEATPTPAVSAFVRAKKLAGAINFTASHNPPEWQGMKFTDRRGAPASKEATAKIEAMIPMSDDRCRMSDIRHPSSVIRPASAREVYYSLLRRSIDFGVIRKARLCVAVDAMHGAGAGWLDGVLRAERIPVAALRTERDVLYGSGMPDPTEPRLQELSRAVRREKAALGLATDGDADRFGVLDEKGRFVPANLVVAMLCDYVLARGARGNLARTVTTTHMVDDSARLHGAGVIETPVGFKYIGDLFLRGEAVAGGEESAGFSAAAHLPEKDGIFAGLLALEMAARAGEPLSALVKDFYRRIGGPRFSARHDIRVSITSFPRMKRKTFAGLRLTGENRTDGVKWLLEGGAWMAMRPSGTEPLVRLYAEARDKAAVKRLLDAGERLIRHGR